jgi:hypothetical protein
MMMSRVLHGICCVMIVLNSLLRICLLTLINFWSNSHLSFGDAENGMIANFAPLSSRVQLDVSLLFFRSDAAWLHAFPRRALQICTPFFLSGQHAQQAFIFGFWCVDGLVGCSSDAEQVSEFAVSAGMWAHGWQALVADASSDVIHGLLVVAQDRGIGSMQQSWMLVGMFCSISSMGGWKAGYFDRVRCCRALQGAHGGCCCGTRHCHAGSIVV